MTKPAFKLERVTRRHRRNILIRKSTVTARGGWRHRLIYVEKVSALIDELNPEGEAMQEILFAKGSLLFRSDKAESKKALEAAMKLAPDSELGKRIEKIIESNFN